MAQQSPPISPPQPHHIKIKILFYAIQGQKARAKGEESNIVFKQRTPRDAEKPMVTGMKGMDGILHLDSVVIRCYPVYPS
jgi:hypothetical protein